MLRIPKNWPLSSYSNSIWVDLVDEPAIVASIFLCNTGPDVINIEIRLEGSGSVTQILPTTEIAPGAAFTFDANVLNVTDTQVLQVRADGQGMSFLANGAVEVSS